MPNDAERDRKTESSLDFWRQQAIDKSAIIAQKESALEEARALIETAEQDGYVSEGWREDARRWAECWRSVDWRREDS